MSNHRRKSKSDLFFSKFRCQMSELSNASDDGGNTTEEILSSLHTVQKKDENPDTVSDLEKRFALDTAALLGGNEFLVAQIYEDRCQQMSFNVKERSTLEWALSRLWNGQDQVEQARQDFLHLDPLNQGHFHKLFSRYAKQNIRRILSNCMLFCSRYEDTEVLQNPCDPEQRCFLINLQHFPFIELPFGHITDVPCNRVAIIYYKRRSESNGPNLDPNPNERIIKISANLALERMMLRAIHFVAAVPVP